MGTFRIINKHTEEVLRQHDDDGPSLREPNRICGSPEVQMTPAGGQFVNSVRV